MLVSRAMRSIRRRAALGGLILVLAGTSTACQSNPEPPPIEAAPATSEPSPSPTPSDAPPTMPAAAKGRSEAAAKAFVRHYVDAVNFAMRTGNTEPLAALRDASCTTCKAIEDRVDEVYGAGGRLEGNGWSIRSLTYVKNAGTGRTLVAAGIDIAPQVTFEQSGASPSHSPQSRGNLDFRLIMTPAGWRVSALEATQ